MNETDRREIRDAVLRYCRGIDRLDMDLVRSTYHPGGIDHHTGFSGPVEEFIPWVSGALARFDGTMHLVGNHLVEGNETVAISETYGNAVHWGSPADDPGRNFTSGFRYIDHFEKRDGCWAVVERWAVREWTRSDVGRLMAKEGAGPSPSRDREDLVYAAMRKAGLA